MLKDLFTIVQNTDTQIIIKLSDKNHPIFKAHFPNYPILPGFLLIEIVVNVLEDTIKKIHSAKFIAYTLPNDTIIYNVKKDALRTKIKIVKDDEQNSKIAEIIYE